MVTGEVQGGFVFYSNAKPLSDDGKVRALAKLDRRSPKSMANIPDLADAAGLSNLDDMSVWLGLVAPKGTPRAVVDRLNSLVRRAMDDPKFRETLLAQGVVPEPSTPEELKTIIAKDYEWNASMAKRFDIKPID